MLLDVYDEMRVMRAEIFGRIAAFDTRADALGDMNYEGRSLTTSGDADSNWVSAFYPEKFGLTLDLKRA